MPSIILFCRLTINYRILYGITSFSLPIGEHVQIYVYALTGQRLFTLMDAYKSEGTLHTIDFKPGSRIASGLYFIVLSTPSSTVIKKAVYLK